MCVKTCFLIILYLNYLESDDVFFLVNQYRPSDKYFCVTNSSNALSWVLKDTTKLFNQASQFIPITIKNTWRFESCSYPPNGSWKCKNSITKKVIFDRRWEELKIYKSDYVEDVNETKSYSLNYAIIENNLGENFDIPLSIRIEKEAHIFLCDGKNVSESRCYCLILYTYNRTKSVLRKCDNRAISSNEYIFHQCPDLVVKKHNGESSPFLSSKIWTHFILSKNQNKINLKKITDHEEEILEYKDEVDAINVTHMMVHSKKIVGLWKIHKVEFFHTAEQTNSVTLDDNVDVTENSVCVSLFIKTCSFCQIKLELKNPRGSSIANKIFNGEAQWKEILFQVNKIQTSKVILTMSTLTDDSENQGSRFWWSFGSLKYCHKNGFRMIQSDDNADCQLISMTTRILNISKKITNAAEIDNCDANTVGSSCLPCFWIINNKTCGQLKICDEKKCSCSAGYRAKSTFTTKCVEKCPKGFYGINCQKKCGNCKVSGCNEIDGKCVIPGCSDNYYGPKCDAPPSKFKYPPKVANVSYESAQILIDNFETTNPNVNLEQFMVEYKLATDSTWNWTIAQENLRFNQKVTIKIEPLKPGFKYFVRCVVTTPGTNPSIEDKLPTTEFTTKCDEITEADVEIKAFNTSADIKLPEKQTLCKYKIFATEMGPGEKTVEVNQNAVQNLTPFKKYKIAIFMYINSVKKEISKLFTTTEGIPDKVKNLNSQPISSSKVFLEWEPPENPNGEIQNYNVKYKLISHKSCKSITNFDSSETKIITLQPSATISDLKPYSTYSFAVFATNSVFQGEETRVKQNLRELDEISEDEIPKIKSIETNTRSANVTFSQISCTKMNGPLFIKLRPICRDDWCPNNKTDSLKVDGTNKLLKALAGLSPFTKYKLRIKFCRNDRSCRNIVEEKNFETLPEAPYIVRDLLVYSKNEHSVSLRWKPPYPPTGTLELYKIGYSSFTENISITNNCELWPEYQCYTVDNLTKNEEYSITVLAKNKETSFGQTASMKAKTIIEKPGPPLNISLSWSLYNEPEISWKHPIIANGEILSFNISVLPHNQTNRSVHDTLDIKKPLILYKKIIEGKYILPSTRYRVTINAFNGFLGDPISIEDISPPSIPTFEFDPEWSATNTTISLSIPPQNNKNNNYTLFLLINDGNTSNHTDIQSLKKKFNTDLSKFTILYHCQLENGKKLQLTIGKNISENNISCSIKTHKFLNPKTTYNFTLLLKNTDSNNNSSYKLLSYIYKTSSTNKAQNKNLFALLILLLIIPAAILIFVKRRSFQQTCKKNSHRPQNEETGTLLASRPSFLGFLKNTKIHSKVVPVLELEEYVKKSLENGELERQHNLFPRGQTKPWEYGALTANKSKNRYTNLIAYDHTRVVLQKINQKEYSDYINANYIDGYKVKRAYIATQGPKMSTVVDFWRMIWQENVINIAMLANIYEGGKKKVEKYWPDNNESLSFGAITVNNVSTEVHTDFEHRIFQVIHVNVTRLVHQYHFSSWPDHGVPLYSQSLIPFLKRLQNIPLDSNSPIVVHCSAGVGRTGTIILCDICLRMAASENVVDILKTFQLLREQRPNMVDNIQQYKLAHLVILEYLTGIETGIACNEIEKKVERLIECDEVSKQMRYLEETEWQVNTMKTGVQKNQKFLIVKEKNRFQNIIPELQGCIFLSPYPFEDESSSYINAVSVDGFRSPGRFIVTQQPMPNTIGDFWRLISQKEISVIISLNEINTKNKTSCLFWPTKNKPELKPVNFMTLTHVNTLFLESYNVISIHMHIEDEEEFKLFEILSYKHWPAKANCPGSIENFLTFMEESNSASRHSNPVLITCFDGALASGLYVALSFVIEKMKMEQICDVCQAVRIVRHNRSQFVTNEEQFTFLYRAAVMYINGFQSYANFN